MRRHRHVVSDEVLGELENMAEQCFSQKGASSTGSWADHQSGDLSCYKAFKEIGVSNRVGGGYKEVLHFLLTARLVTEGNLCVIHLRLETELVPLRRVQVEIVVVKGCIFWVIRDKHGLFVSIISPKWCEAVIVWLRISIS